MFSDLPLSIHIFDADENGIFFLKNPISNSLLLMLRNISSGSILVDSLDFFIYMSLGNVSFFQVVCLLFFFPYCSVTYCTSRTSRTMLDRSGKSGHSGLLILGRKVFIYHYNIKVSSSVDAFYSNANVCPFLFWGFNHE